MDTGHRVIAGAFVTRSRYIEATYGKIVKHEPKQAVVLDQGSSAASCRDVAEVDVEAGSARCMIQVWRGFVTAKIVTKFD